MKGGIALRRKIIAFWLQKIFLLLVASIRRKLLKTTHAEERSVHIHSESCSDRKIINLIPNKISVDVMSTFFEFLVRS